MYLRFSLLLLCGLLIPYSAVLAGDGENKDDLTRQLLEEVRQLKARVVELEARSPKKVEGAFEEPPTAVPAPAASPHEHDAEQDALQDPHANHSFLSSPALNFHGYADLGYRAITNGGKNSFRLGQADLFLSSKLSEKLSFLMETAIDSDQNNTPGIEIERILLNYRQNDYINLSAGRYHSALGYFNGAFHHGRWFQTAVDRPFLFEFEDEGGILPIHNVGLSVAGKLPSGDLRLSYVAEMGNGRSYRQGMETVQTRFSVNNGKSANFALFANPRALPGWQFGASFYRNRIAPDGILNIDQRIFTVHAVYLRDRYEFLNEGVLMQHNPAGSARTSQVPGFYSQLAYRIGSVSRPYFRYEYMNASASDPVVGPLLGNAGRRQSVTAGYRYDLAEFCAIKFQLERVQRRSLGASTEGAVQLSFAF